MDTKTSIAVIKALKYKLETKDCKVNLPKDIYIKAIDRFDYDLEMAKIF